MSHRQYASYPTPIPAALPVPDEYGTFWLERGSRRCEGAAIFRSGRPASSGKYFASRGVPGGVLTCQGGLRYFDSADEALAALRAEDEVR